MTPEREFVEACRVQRKLRGWSQQRLAVRLGKHGSTVNRWESGRQSLFLDDALCLSEVLGVPVQVPESARVAYEAGVRAERARIWALIGESS